MKQTRKVEISEERLAYDDFFKITAGRFKFEKFNGEMSEEVRRLCLDRGDAVAVVLFNRQTGKLVLIEQFRYPVYRALQGENGWLCELVAGVVEAGETPKEVVAREVMEEAGYRIKNVKLLSTVFPSPGGVSERVYIFYAEVAGRENAGGGLAVEQEDIRVMEVPVGKVYAMLKKGQIEDAKTVIGLMQAEKLIRRKSKPVRRSSHHGKNKLER
jgi:ADP-ribose pyrophosphatase